MWSSRKQPGQVEPVDVQRLGSKLKQYRYTKSQLILEGVSECAAILFTQSPKVGVFQHAQSTL